MYVKQITIRSLRQPTDSSVNGDIKWFCKSLGLLGERDKEKSGFRIFKAVVGSGERGISADELSGKTGLSRTAVVHHIETMMNAGLVVKEGSIYELRMKSLQKVVDEIKLDIERILKSVRQIAEDIDRELMLPVRKRSSG